VPGTTSTVIALLRAVNVGGRKPVPMSDLRGWLEELGFSDVRSVLQSGNVVFRSDAVVGTDIERFLEAEAAKRLQLHTDFFARTVPEWKRIVESNPFGEEAERDPGHLLILFLKDVPDSANVEALQASISGPEIVRFDGRNAYAVYPAGIGQSRLTTAAIEKKLGMRCTGRNWNTVRKLFAIARS
jgi:uncharacterized protein (DUF1697 family)